MANGVHIFSHTSAPNLPNGRSAGGDQNLRSFVTTRPTSELTLSFIGWLFRMIYLNVFLAIDHSLPSQSIATEVFNNNVENFNKGAKSRDYRGPNAGDTLERDFFGEVTLLVNNSRERK